LIALSETKIFFSLQKEEPMDDNRNDSGVTSESDPSVSPESDRSGMSHPTTSPVPKGMYSFNSLKTESQFPWYGSHQNSPTSRPGPSSPENHTENSVDAQTSKNDEDSNDYDDEDISNPKVNSHGRVKIQKCRQCDFFTYTKKEFWKHTRVHLKSDKILNCPKCPFVTEYKHHLEYHLLNHAGAKPFKCPHCDYSCVNKSMLNSHLKSHSKIYQYRCANCNYETKYCHSLKLHLRKYGHKPDVVLHPDGTPNPYPVIDVYGTRRGPKVKKTESSPSMPSVAPLPQVEPQSQQMNVMNPLLANPGPMLPFPLLPFSGFPPGVPPEAVIAFLKERFELMGQANTNHQTVERPAPVPEPSEGEALDLTQKSADNSVNGESDNDEENMTTVFGNVEVVENPRELKKEHETSTSETVNTSANFTCKHCGIIYPDEIMYRVHMGFHGYNDPLTCNMCGEQLSDKYTFFMHIARVAH